MSEDITRRLRLLLGDDELVRQYTQQYGSVIDIGIIREMKDSGNASSEEEVGEDPVYELTLHCPVCNNKNVTGYNLKAKSQKVEGNLFLIPRYTGVGKYRKVNFNLLKTIVCNKCFFASPDIKDFTKVNDFSNKLTKSQLTVNPDFVSHLRSSMDERIAFVAAAFPDVTGDPFLRPRSVDTAIISIKLSMLRAEQEMDSGFPYSHYKIGNYHLQIAELQRLAGRENRESIEAASEEFMDAFDNSDCPQTEIEVKTLYLLIATLIKQGNAKRAGEYLRFFDEIIKELNDQMYDSKYKAKYKKMIGSVDGWKSRTMNLWEYRDDPEFWKDV
ncbi:DUF2225 domain-containing protein [Chitinivibrio alkaliphilus]|uniref:DUF2225 domain-containing protein n=1 Tax=Chitinivibrio alkaliphilus ACht1 TaxID=1313304 RepID=U7D4V8_9BACT|nr:DUF2225 domain-containing protein [Chitinivibrio alkaliphilus]ERP31549.1 hypothetical protein CALK_1594 [Chitinivibrio alkaliphilus ACht1]